jgi:hypothetical protein
MIDASLLESRVPRSARSSLTAETCGVTACEIAVSAERFNLRKFEAQNQVFPRW